MRDRPHGGGGSGGCRPGRGEGPRLAIGTGVAGAAAGTGGALGPLGTYRAPALARALPVSRVLPVARAAFAARAAFVRRVPPILRASAVLRPARYRDARAPGAAEGREAVRAVQGLRVPGVGCAGGRDLPHHDVVRNQHDRRGPAVRRRAQGDGDAVPVGQLSYHEHAETQVVGERDHVELRGHRELFVEGRVVLLRHTEAAVLDLDDQALGDHPGPHRDGARRGGVRGRVVDELGQQMDDVGDRGRGDVHLLLGVHLHPLVLGDLTDRAAQDVHQRDRLGPAAARPFAADDDEVLLVAAQLAGRGVQFVQALEDVGVAVLALQRVQLAQLEVDEVLALPGDAKDDLLEAAPGVGEFDRGVHGRALGGVERLGHLAEFVVPVVQRGRRRLRVDRLAPLQPGHHVRQPLLREAERGQAQTAQPPGQRAGDPPGHADAQQQREQPAGAQGRRLDQRPVRLVGAALQQPRRLLLDETRVVRGQLVHRGVPPLLRVRQGDPVRFGAGVPGRQHLVLDRLQRPPLRARQDPLGLCLGLAGQLGHDLVLDQPAPGVHEFRVLHPRLVVQMPRRPGQGQLRVLPGDQLRRVLQRDQRAGLRGEVAVVDLGELLEGVDLVVDDRGVLVQRLLGVMSVGSSTWSR